MNNQISNPVSSKFWSQQIACYSQMLDFPVRIIFVSQTPHLNNLIFPEPFYNVKRHTDLMFA